MQILNCDKLKSSATQGYQVNRSIFGLMSVTMHSLTFLFNFGSNSLLPQC